MHVINGKRPTLSTMNGRQLGQHLFNLLDQIVPGLVFMPDSVFQYNDMAATITTDNGPGFTLSLSLANSRDLGQMIFRVLPNYREAGLANEISPGKTRAACRVLSLLKKGGVQFDTHMDKAA